MPDILSKVNAAIHFGVPDGSVAGEIMEEVQALVVTNIVLERKLARIRAIAEETEYVLLGGEILEIIDE